ARAKPGWLFCTEKGGLDDFAGPVRARGNGELMSSRELPELALSVGRPALADAGEERSEAPELLAFPVRERMVVALSALDAEPKEDAGRACRQVLRLAVLRDVKGLGSRSGSGVGGGSSTVGPKPRRQDLPDDLVVAHVLGHALAEPGLEGRCRLTDRGV